MSIKSIVLNSRAEASYYFLHELHGLAVTSASISPSAVVRSLALNNHEPTPTDFSISPDFTELYVQTMVSFCSHNTLTSP
jgi:hypothetical protein